MQEIRIQPFRNYLIRAKWIFPIISSPIFDGAVEIKGGRITRVDKFKILKKEKTYAEFLDLEEIILLPCLVNVHTHLELSALRFKILPSSNFFIWVKSVIEKRQKLKPEEIRRYAYLSLVELWYDGVGIIGDVQNNSTISDLLLQSPFYGYIFKEILDFKGTYKLREIKNLNTNSKFKITYSAHAPYTVAPLLLQAIKSYNKKRKKIFTIHCAESPEEVEFLITGEGPIAELLKERGQWNRSFVPPKLTPVKYLDKLNLLDKDTLLIHVIHVSEEDLNILKRTNVKICVCPRSNIYTGVGIPHIDKFYQVGIDICLGTDSLASNETLSIWEEMKIIFSFYPSIPLNELLKMATYNGAKALQFNDLGAIAPGYKVNLIGVEIIGYLSDNAKAVLEKLINQKKEIKYRIYG